MQPRHGFGLEFAIDQFVHDDAAQGDPVCFGGAQVIQPLRTQLVRVDAAVDQPARAQDADAPVAARTRFGRDLFGDMQPRQRGIRQYVAQRLVDGVVGADQEVGARARQLAG
ncbi:hypothetical protein D3C78_1094220 [compost metagenome]